LAMLLPMTLRFLLVALRPDRPCWNAMVGSLRVRGLRR
jgi:hypothetical protein